MKFVEAALIIATISMILFYTLEYTNNIADKSAVADKYVHRFLNGRILIKYITESPDYTINATICYLNITKIENLTEDTFINIIHRLNITGPIELLIYNYSSGEQILKIGGVANSEIVQKRICQSPAGEIAIEVRS